MNRRSAFFAAALGVVLLGTIVLWVALPPQLTRHVLAFPDTAGGTVHHEVRFLPRRTTRVESVRLYTEEIILGPAHVGAVPFVPPETEINALFLDREGRLYVDFSTAIMFASGGATAIEDIRELIEWNLTFNFRYVNEVVLTIDGQVPGFPPIIPN